MAKRGLTPFQVKLDPAARADMLRHARDEAPNECCGLLVGRRGLVESAVRARNLEASASRYLIDPADHFAAMRTARSNGQRVIGAYHSHPASAPMPSESDIAEASGGRDFLWVIASPAEGELRGYYLRDGEIVFVDFVEA
jgi:proteasome lid subunit RPN8/RPN11